jgi:hypothetical protein
MCRLDFRLTSAPPIICQPPRHKGQVVDTHRHIGYHSQVPSGSHTVVCGYTDIKSIAYSLYLFCSSAASTSKGSLICKNKSNEGFYPGFGHPKAKNPTSCMFDCIDISMMHRCCCYREGISLLSVLDTIFVYCRCWSNGVTFFVRHLNNFHAVRFHHDSVTPLRGCSG